MRYLGMLLENSELKMNLYDINQEKWEEISIPEAIGETLFLTLRPL